MKKTVYFLSFILALFLFTSCNKSIVFEETVCFPDANWTFEQKEVTFNVPFTGSDKPYAVIIDIDLIGTPNVDKFYSSFTIFTPNGGKTVKTLHINFETPKEPFIKGANPNEKTYRLTAYPKKYFSETGIYKFEINQFSNKADNYGIKGVRLRIEKVKE